MRTTIFLFALLLPASPCCAQILIKPDPHATSYLFYAGQPPRAVIAPMTDEEKAKLQQIYTKVLKDNSALDAEGDAVAAQLNTYRNTLLAAMIKADPKLASVLGTSGSPITSAQSDEIRQTQAQVMQAEPDLQSGWDDLMKKMTAHQQAVDAAMVKVDPTMAQILAKLSP